MVKLHRSVASYECIAPADVCAMSKLAMLTFVTDAQADIATLADLSSELVSALQIAEAFVAGFEGDDLQDGIATILETIRTPIAKAEAV